MKKFIPLVLLIALAVTGCIGPRYSKQADYDRGNWHFNASNQEVFQRQLQILALEKLKEQPVQVQVTTNGVFKGYLGIIANMSRYQQLTFRYSGPEHGLEVLAQGQQIEKYLLPGVYSGEIINRGRVVSSQVFVSEPQEKGFLGKKYHWIFFQDR